MPKIGGVSVGRWPLSGPTLVSPPPHSMCARCRLMGSRPTERCRARLHRAGADSLFSFKYSPPPYPRRWPPPPHTPSTTHDHTHTTPGGQAPGLIKLCRGRVHLKTLYRLGLASFRRAQLNRIDLSGVEKLKSCTKCQCSHSYLKSIIVDKNDWNTGTMSRF